VFIKEMSMIAKTQLCAAQLQALEVELDDLRRDVVATIGERDARHIRRMVRIARYLGIAGRALLMFGFGPIAWLCGVLSLATAKILENMEVGHNVMHGQYDWMNDAQLHSQTYEWDIVCDGDHWRHSHNVEHHNHTNIIGRDHDYGYGMLRLSEQQRWTRDQFSMGRRGTRHQDRPLRERTNGQGGIPPAHAAVPEEGRTAIVQGLCAVSCHCVMARPAGIAG
jgi:fatty acid desaturase